MSKKEKIGIFVLRLLIWILAIFFILVLIYFGSILVRVYDTGLRHRPYEWGCWDFEEWHVYGWDAVEIQLDTIVSLIRYSMPVVGVVWLVQFFAFCGLHSMKQMTQQDSQEKGEKSDDK